MGEFLKREYTDDEPWKGFFKLWLDARGYHYSSSESGIVDGARDAGIDAIAMAPNETSHLQPVVVQSKYFQGNIPPYSLKRFLDTVRLFRIGSSRDFEIWLNNHVRESLKPRYQKLWNKRNRIRFVLVTSGRIQREDIKTLKKLKVEIQDKAKILSLLTDMAEGKTPRPEMIKLKFFGRAMPMLKSSEHRLYVLSALLSDFSKAYENHEDNLFAGNVRLALEGGTSSGVKQGLRETIEGAPEEFAYYHNGITIICRKISFRNGVAVLFSPSIVNGAQTVTFIGRSMRREVPRSAKVLVKVVEVSDDEKFTRFETDIAISSNTQNKVNLSDLSVVNPDLVSLERYFAGHNWFLQRKRGKFPAGSPKGKITKDELLQCMAALDPKTGPSSAKDKQKLYKYHSGRLFSQYAMSLEGRRNALFIAQLSVLLRRAISSHKGARSGQSNRISLAKYPTFAIFCDALARKGYWGKVRRQLLEDGLNKRADSNRLLEAEIKKVLRKVLSYSRTQARQSELTAYFKNKESVRSLTRKLVPGLSRNMKLHIF